MMSTQTRSQVQSKKMTSADVGIPLRHLSFDFPQASPRYFVLRENALATALMVVFSGYFPPGERFFVDSVRHFRDQVTDPVLKAQISGFIGQEALHGREHDRLNDFLASRGFDIAMADRMVKVGLNLLRKLPASQQLACTILMEHFTAHLAEQWLTNEQFYQQSDPEMLNLWYWHALEELEHKSVAYDLYTHVSGNYVQRVISAPLVALALGPGLLVSMGWVMAREGQLLNTRENVRGLKFLFGRDGFITNVIAQIPSFFATSFHPSQDDTRELEAATREKLFGREGYIHSAGLH